MNDCLKCVNYVVKFIYIKGNNPKPSDDTILAIYDQIHLLLNKFDYAVVSRHPVFIERFSKIFLGLIQFGFYNLYNKICSEMCETHTELYNNVDPHHLITEAGQPHGLRFEFAATGGGTIAAMHDIVIVYRLAKMLRAHEGLVLKFMVGLLKEKKINVMHVIAAVFVIDRDPHYMRVRSPSTSNIVLPKRQKVIYAYDNGLDTYRVSNALTIMLLFWSKESIESLVSIITHYLNEQYNTIDADHYLLPFIPIIGKHYTLYFLMVGNGMRYTLYKMFSETNMFGVVRYKLHYIAHGVIIYFTCILQMLFDFKMKRMLNVRYKTLFPPRISEKRADAGWSVARTVAHNMENEMLESTHDGIYCLNLKKYATVQDYRAKLASVVAYTVTMYPEVQLDPMEAIIEWSNKLVTGGATNGDTTNGDATDGDATDGCDKYDDDEDIILVGTD